MTTVEEVEKNKLDLMYREQLQRFNAYLIATTTGIIGFAGTFIWFPDKILFGGLISLGVIFLFLYLVKNAKREMKKLMNEMDSLKKSIKRKK